MSLFTGSRQLQAHSDAAPVHGRSDGGEAAHTAGAPVSRAPAGLPAAAAPRRELRRTNARQGDLEIPDLPGATVRTAAGAIRSRGRAGHKNSPRFGSKSPRLKHPAYTTDGLSKTLYHAELAKVTGNLLNIDQIIIDDEVKTRKPIKGKAPAVFSFLEDPRVKTADTIGLATVLLTIFVTPLTFMWDGFWARPELVPFGRTILIMDVLIDIVYACYCYLRLHMTFLHPVRKTEVADWRDIRSALRASPLYWLMWASTATNLWSLLGFSLLLNNIKAVRMAHIVWLPDSFWLYADKSWARLAKPLVLLIGSAHWMACLLTYLGGYRQALFEECENYVTYLDVGTGSSWTVSCGPSLYFMAFAEALYMLTGALDNPTGAGPRESNFGALLIVSVFAPIGCVVTALIIAGIVKEQSMATALEMRHQENKAFMKRAMTSLGIPQALRQRVESMHYYQKMGHDTEAFGELFDPKRLSPPLHASLLAYNYWPLIDNPRSYFKGKDPNYIIAILKVLEDRTFLPGDYVVRKGEIASEMMFVNRGRLAVLVSIGQTRRVSTTVEVTKLQEGDNFGETCLVTESLRTAWVSAESYVLVAALSRNDILPIWKFYPEEEDQLREKVRLTKQADKDRQREKPRGSVGFREEDEFDSTQSSSDHATGDEAANVTEGLEANLRASRRAGAETVLHRGADCGRGRWRDPPPDGDLGRGRHSSLSSGATSVQGDAAAALKAPLGAAPARAAAPEGDERRRRRRRDPRAPAAHLRAGGPAERRRQTPGAPPRSAAEEAAFSTPEDATAAEDAERRRRTSEFEDPERRRRTPEVEDATAAERAGEVTLLGRRREPSAAKRLQESDGAAKDSSQSTRASKEA